MPLDAPYLPIPSFLEDILISSRAPYADDVLKFITDNYTIKTDSDFIFKDGAKEYKLIDVFDKIIKADKRSIFETMIKDLPQSLGLDLSLHEALFMKIALDENAFGIILTLIQNGSILSQEQKDKILVHACENGYGDLSKELIEMGADPNAFIEAKKRIGDGAFRAGRGGRSSQGSNSSRYISTITSALSAAIDYESEPLVNYLLNSGANPNAHNGLALVTASKIFYEAIFQALINGGADVLGCKEPLIRNAIEHKNVELIDLLLENGADISYLTHRDIKKLIKRCNVDLLRKLAERGLDISLMKPLNPEVRVREIASYLQELGMDIEGICDLMVQ